MLELADEVERGERVVRQEQLLDAAEGRRKKIDSEDAAVVKRNFIGVDEGGVLLFLDSCTELQLRHFEFLF